MTPQLQESRTYIALSNLPDATPKKRMEYLRKRFQELTQLTILNQFTLSLLDRLPAVILESRHPILSIKGCVTTFAQGKEFSQKQWGLILYFAANHLIKSELHIKEDEIARAKVRGFAHWGWINLYQLLTRERDVLDFVFWELLEDYLDYERGVTQTKPLVCPGCNRIFMQSRPNQLSCSAYCRTLKSKLSFAARRVHEAQRKPRQQS